MSKWNKNNFKNYWRDEAQEYWIKEWEDNYDEYANEFRRVIKPLLKFRWNTLCEVGCGNGKNLCILEDAFEDVILFGTDINEDFLKIADKSGINVMNQNTERLDIAPVDVILSYEHLQHLHPESFKLAVERIKDCCQYVVIYEGYKKGGGVIKSGHGGRWGHEYEQAFGWQVVYQDFFDNNYILLILKK